MVQIIVFVVLFFLLALLIQGLTVGNVWAWIILVLLILFIIGIIIDKISKTEQAKSEADAARILKELQNENAIVEAKLLEEKRLKEFNLLQIENVKKENLQKDYVVRIDQLYSEVYNNPELKRILDKFLLQLPPSLVNNTSYFTTFECLLLGSNEIGQKVLWSSNKDIQDLQLQLSKRKELINHIHYYSFSPLRYEKENELFINDKVLKLIKLLKEIIIYENDFDYSFVILRFIQLSLSSCNMKEFEEMTAILDGDIDAISLDECLFNYYSKYKSFVGNLLIDPWISIFTHLMINNLKFGAAENIDYFNYPKRRNEIIQLINEKKEVFDYKIFKNEIKNRNDQVEVGCTIQDVDLMNGDEFENFVARIFSKMGYKSKVTKHSGDFGIDVLAEKDGIRFGIQSKCYSKPVSNSAIQEITAGMKYYNCQRGIVVTNRTFTKAAISLAQSNSIQLWDRKKLEEKISELF